MNALSSFSYEEFFKTMSLGYWDIVFEYDFSKIITTLMLEALLFLLTMNIIFGMSDENSVYPILYTRANKKIRCNVIGYIESP
jgi:hypothetical protein